MAAKETYRSTGKALAALFFNNTRELDSQDAILFHYWEAITNQGRLFVRIHMNSHSRHF
ncbi:hypothetical protein Bca4012_027108 [Brassica carinata]